MDIYKQLLTKNVAGGMLMQVFRGVNSVPKNPTISSLWEHFPATDDLVYSVGIPWNTNLDDINEWMLAVRQKVNEITGKMPMGWTTINKGDKLTTINDKGS